MNNPFDSETESQSEFKLHLAIKKHVENCFIGTHNPNLKFWHPANENRSAEQGYWNKVMGQLKGLSDFEFGWPWKEAGHMEVKLPGKKLTPEQNKFLSWARSIGRHTAVSYSVRQAHFHLCTWGLKPAYDYNPSVEPDQRTEQQKFSYAFDYYKP